jgi:hypothetical protein
VSNQPASMKSLVPIIGVPAVAVLTLILRAPLGDVIAPPVAAAIPAAIVGWIEWRELRAKPREQRLAEALSGENFREPWMIAGAISLAMIAFQFVAGGIVGVVTAVAVHAAYPSATQSAITPIVTDEAALLVPLIELPFLYFLFRAAAYKLRSDRMKWISVGIAGTVAVGIVVTLMTGSMSASGVVSAAVVIGIQLLIATRAVRSAERSRDVHRLRQAYRAMKPEDRLAFVEIGLGAAGQSVEPTPKPEAPVVRISEAPSPVVRVVPARPDM